MPLDLVEEILGKSAVTKQQPVFSCCTTVFALLDEATERGNSGSWANHDQRRIIITRQFEVVIVFDEDFNRSALF
ncbi:Uncharacterised protein [Vibrio cholerae]|nr:Uncharacterised protein [Vibrio cholerae]